MKSFKLVVCVGHVACALSNVMFDVCGPGAGAGRGRRGRGRGAGGAAVGAAHAQGRARRRAAPLLTPRRARALVMLPHQTPAYVLSVRSINSLLRKNFAEYANRSVY